MLTREQIVQALTRLGELAHLQGETIELLVVGGTALLLAYNLRPSTHDVDVVILAPREMFVRGLALDVAAELGLHLDWLNDAGRLFVVDRTPEAILLTKPGIVVMLPAVAQLLAMKLSAWRDNVDEADAFQLLQELMRGRDPTVTRATIWQEITGYLRPQAQERARAAFGDLWRRWEDTRANSDH